MFKVNEEPRDYELDLSTLAGGPVRVFGYVSHEFGGGKDRTFKLTRVVVVGKNVEFGAEGEHDMPYLTGVPLPDEAEEEA